MSFGSILYTSILYPVVQIIEIAFRIFDKLFDNTGIAIIGVSFTVTLLCLPLYIVAEHWQQVERDTQSKLKPGIDRIKQTFKGDEQYMILTTFYRQNHYHPMMALRSSFGLLIQIPFFMAAYSCLSKLPALQGHSFLFIKDMGVQDAVFHIGNFPINILPIAMTLINIVAGAIYCKGFPFKEKAQIYGMALLFLVILYKSPAGLVLYWTMNNVFSLVKNIFYKLKKPLQVFYYCVVAGIIFISIYVLFIYDGGANLKKRLCAVIPMLFIIPIPFYLKGINWLINNLLKELVDNSKIRFGLFLTSSISIALLTGLVLPSNLITSSVQEFSNIGTITCASQFLHSPFWQSIGLFVLWPICIYFLFNKKIQSIISTIFSIGLICSLINSFAFTGNYGSMDTTLKFIDGFNNPSLYYMFINALVLIIIVVLVNIVIKFNKTKIINYLFSVLSFSFIVLSIINVSKIKSEYKEYQNIALSKDVDSTSTKLHFTKNGKNIVILMLDRAASAYFEDILNDRPELKQIYSGFTYYKNVLSYNGHTLMASPNIFGGYEYTPYEMNKRSDESLKSKHNEALLVLPKLLTEQANFNATLADMPWGNYSYNSDMRFVEGINDISGYKFKGRYAGEFKKQYIKTDDEKSLSYTINRNLFWVSLFREVPVCLRPVIYYKGSWWATEAATDIDSFTDEFSTLYYLNKITDFNNNKNNFIVIDNETTHTGQDISYLNLTDEENVKYKADKDDCYEIQLVSYEAVGKWITYLKENKVYDNTRIIIVADHGIGYGKNANNDYETSQITGIAKDHFHPILLVKDFNSTGELKTDMQFMTTADVPSITLEGIIKNPINPFTGNEITTTAKENGVYITADDIFMPHHSKSNKIFTVADSKWFKVKDNIFIDSNWTQEVPQ